MVIFASYFWMVASFINMFIFGFVGYKTKKMYHILYALMWFSCGMWGMTVPAMNIPFIKFINTIIIPITAGLCGILGASMLLSEIISDKQKN